TPATMYTAVVKVDDRASVLAVRSTAGVRPAVPVRRGPGGLALSAALRFFADVRFAALDRGLGLRGSAKADQRGCKGHHELAYHCVLQMSSRGARLAPERHQHITPRFATGRSLQGRAVICSRSRCRLDRSSSTRWG